MKKVSIFLFPVVVFLYFQIAGTGCANIIPPQGGPRDSLPPRVVEASPPSGTVNFKGNKITLTFDEYLDDLQDVQNNLLFTPLPPTSPKVEVKLRTMTIRLPDSLDANTTYVFNFGNAIRDVNEGNVARNFVYTFSTGPTIDSLELKGKVVLAETGGMDTTLVVVLHRELNDSAILKQRPRYVARLNGRGEFHFKNLPQGIFNIYAIGDAGLAKRYLSKAQTFAFADQPVTISDSAAQVTLYAYKEKPVIASTPAVSTTNRAGNTNDRRLKFTMNLSAGRLDLLKDLEINFEQKLKYLDSSKLRLASDSSFKAEAFSVMLDSTKKRATVKANWKEGTQYHLIVDKDFAEDSLGKKLLKSDTLSFATKKRNEYGTIVVKLKNTSSVINPVLQLIQNGNIMYSAPFVSGVVRNELFVPGEYEIRILEDRNGNGKWDPGQFLPGKKQPEIARPVERKLTVRAGFQNELELAL